MLHICSCVTDTASERAANTSLPSHPYQEFFAELAEEAHTPADLPRFYNPAHLRRWIGVWSHSCALDASRQWDAAFADLEPVGRPRLEPLATPHGGQR